jgi:hypothetical protein
VKRGEPLELGVPVTVAHPTSISSAPAGGANDPTEPPP